MGGHGALTTALKTPGRYTSVSAFAPICNPIQCPWGQKAFNGYLGADQVHPPPPPFRASTPRPGLCVLSFGGVSGACLQVPPPCCVAPAPACVSGGSRRLQTLSRNHRSRDQAEANLSTPPPHDALTNPPKP